MSKRDNSVKVRICILNKQNSSINFSIRLKEPKDDVIKQIVEFLKEKL